MIRTPLVAGAIAYTVDTQGTLWLRAFDLNVFLICVCPVPAEGALQLADYIDGHYDIDVDDDDEIGEVAGNA